MSATVYFERRMQNFGIGFNERRSKLRRNGGQVFASDRRRPAALVRQGERTRVRIPVRMSVGLLQLSGVTREMSPEGMSFTSEVPIATGTPMSLQISFGDNVCYLNVSGQVIFCLSQPTVGPEGNVVGIKFSGTRDWERKIIASAIEELKANNETQDKSLLTIHVSEQSLALEAAKLAERFRKENELEPWSVRSEDFTDIERRFSPRAVLDVALEILVNENNPVKGQIINMSEAGIRFRSDGKIRRIGFPIEVRFSTLDSQDAVRLPIRVLWDDQVDESKFDCGARFVFPDDKSASHVRDVLFDAYAGIASASIKRDEGLKKKVEAFIKGDVKQYCDDMAALARVAENNGSESDEVWRRLTAITDNVLQKGDEIEKLVANSVAMKKIKEVFRDLSGCWVYKSAIMKNAYSKPRGYPGDYKLFEVIYSNKPRSENIGRYFDRYFLENTYTKAVRSRKNKMKNILMDTIENVRIPKLRILDIACGACKEIRELFSDPHFTYKKEVFFTGLDNDQGALELSRHSLEHLPPNIHTRFLKENVLDLFRDEKYYDILGKQDIIYILGLSEYLPDRIFKKLVKFLFNLLDSKGKLIITYKDKNIPNPAIPPDWLCDWPFVKRSEEDLVNVAKELGEGNYSLKIERESTGCIFFMQLTKQ